MNSRTPSFIFLFDLLLQPLEVGVQFLLNRVAHDEGDQPRSAEVVGRHGVRDVCRIIPLR